MGGYDSTEWPKLGGWITQRPRVKLNPTGQREIGNRETETKREGGEGERRSS